MKVGIVTLHKVLNFGSVLQAYCTCVVLKRFGFEPEIIDYMEPRFTIQGAVKGIFREVFHGKQKRSLASKLVLSLMKTLSYAIQYMNFERFISSHLTITQSRFTNFDSILKTPPYADIYLTGSDQVWNSEYNSGIDRAHFLDFAPAGKPRISYAASFGKDKLRPEEFDETRELLQKYSSISVRESSGVQIVDDLGIPGAQHVLDPTLLLSREEWAKEFVLVRPEKDRYLLIYSVERSLDEIVYSAARKIADAKGLPVVFLSQAAKLSTMKSCESQRSFSEVKDFLRYFYHADFVVASSFHGTAFAINFNRQFVSVLPPKFGARPRSLLNLVGLNDRIVEDGVDLDKVSTFIDYTAVNRILEQERKRSLAFLETSTGSHLVAS
jgi:Polysaccharide pyruvyl transferase